MVSSSHTLIAVGRKLLQLLALPAGLRQGSTNPARLGYGVAIKLYGGGFNAPSEYIARMRAVMDRNNIPWQTQTPKVDVGGGGTIGAFMSRYDMNVIDLGVSLLSMHSPFEMSSKVDVWNFYRAMSAFFSIGP